MKKLLFVLLVVSAITVSGQKISKTFKFNNYSIQQIDNHDLIKIKNTKNMAAPGNPMQPYFLTNMLLPPGAEIENVEIETNDIIYFQLSADLMPMQHVRPLSYEGTSDFIKNDEAYQKEIALVYENSISFHQERLNGYEIAQIKFSPIQYLPITQTIEFAKSVTIHIHYSINGKSPVQMLSQRAKVQQVVSKLCDNPEDMKGYTIPNKKNPIVDALIITPADYVADFEPLVEDYQKRALSVEVVSVESIEAGAAGSDLQEKIRNTIIDYYQNSDVRYVLLGGDIEHIPHRGFYCEVQSSSLMTDDDIPSDLYYQALDGNWNTDGDNLWGEPDEDDLLPEVALSRMPFSTHEDLQNMLYKTLRYTNNPVEGELNNPLLAGEHLWDDPLTWGAQYLDLIHGIHDDNGYTTSGIPNDHPYDTLYDRNGTWDDAQIIAEINSGHPFIHHVGHSNTDYAMRLYNSDITTSNFEQVDGVTHNFPIIYTHGCICGSFDANDCIAEKMLQLDRFASAFIGNSRYGWFNEGQTEGPSQHLHREFVNALYADKVNFLAEAHLISKIESSGWVEALNQHEQGAIRWVFYDCNAMGDPTLPIWTDELQTLDITIPDGILIGASQVTLDASISSIAAQNIYITLAKDGVIYGSGVTDATGSTTIELIQPFANMGEAEIIYSGYNVLKDTILETLTRPQEGYLVVSGVNLGTSDQPIYGSTYNVDMVIENVGENASAINTVQVSTNSEYATITAEELTINEIAGLQTETILNSFELQISDIAPDQSVIEINFDFYVNGDLHHNMKKSLIVKAPNLNWELISINDELGGNNNGIFELGEILCLEATLSNSGSINPQMIKSYFTEWSGNVNLLTDTIFYSPEQENQYTLAFVIETLPEAESNQQVSFTFGGKYDEYDIPEEDFQLTIGLAIEDFESGDFTKYEWNNDIELPWSVQSSEVYEGTYSAMSADINDDENSELSITLNVTEDDIISFMFKVSCEDSYSSLWDYLEFSIDGNSMDTWDGITEWAEASYPVTAGTHTFKWNYVKDGSVTEGEDCVWLDNIVLPVPGNEPPAENNAPEFTSGNIISCEAGQSFSHAITAIDADDDPLSAHLIMTPEWVELMEVAEGEWQLNGSIPLGMVEAPQIIVGASDGYEFASQCLNLDIDGLSINDHADFSEFSVFPQPANATINIRTELNHTINNIAIYNSTGQLELVKNVGQLNLDIYTIDINQLKSGVYFVSVTTNEGRQMNRKIFIE